MAELPKVQETLDKLTEQLEQLPEKDRAEFIQIVTKFSGPLPPPGDFAQYEETLPGAGDRIVDDSRKKRWMG